MKIRKKYKKLKKAFKKLKQLNEANQSKPFITHTGALHASVGFSPSKNF